MRCILHIGIEKTGTTSFQRYMARNRDRLLSQGVFYPRSLGSETHRLLSMYAMSVETPDDAFFAHGLETQDQHDAFRAKLEQRFREEVEALGPAETCVISGEHLHSRLRNEEQIARVREFLAQHFDEISVFAHLRPQVDVLVSLASTQTRVGGTVRRGFFDRATPDRMYFNYNTLITAWEAVFGGGAVHCIPFQVTPDFTALILDRLEIDQTDFEPYERLNEALDVRVMAIVNALVDSGTGQKVDHRVLDLMPVEQPLRLDRSMAQAIHARFVASNQTLIARRDDMKPGDLQPRWDRYPEIGNVGVLEHQSPFAGSLAHLVRYYNEVLAARD